MNITVSFDEPTRDRLAEFSKKFHASPSTIAAGLIRAALRHELRPEASIVPPGRPVLSTEMFVKRLLARRPSTLEQILKEFPNFDVASTLKVLQLEDRLLPKQIYLDEKKRYHVSPRWIPYEDNNRPEPKSVSAESEPKPRSAADELFASLDAAEDP